MASYMEERTALKRYAWLSIGAAVITITLKFGAYLLTNSVGLLSDAMEAFVNLATGVLALVALSIAARPADEDHAYGYSKAEYFSSGAEGTLILIAAISILVAAVERFIVPRALEHVGVGLAVSLSASLVNLGASMVLSRAGKRHHSISLEAHARHLMTDVWTAGGVVIGVGLVGVTGWNRLDPVVAMLVAANIIRSGVIIVRRSVLGLMDVRLPVEETEKLETALAPFMKRGIQVHALRTRQAGARRFVSMHVVVPGSWTVHEGHRLLENIESEIRKVLSPVTVFTHLESLDDPSSWDDVALDRDPQGRGRSGTNTLS